MQVKESTMGNVTVYELEGRLDTVTAPDFQTRLMDGIGEGTGKFLINCTDMEYISSSGLRVFLMGLKKVKSGGGDLRICGLKDGIREIFDIAGFTKLFTILDTCGDY